MSGKFAVLIATVAAFQSVAEGAAHLLSDLHQRLETATQNDDMDEVRDIVASLNASKDELAGAVAANTIADPATTGEESTAATVSGGEGSETLDGGNGSDTVDGGAAGDSLDTTGGGQASDTISGGEAEDTLAGSTGDDTLQGGQA